MEFVYSFCDLVLSFEVETSTFISLLKSGRRENWRLGPVAVNVYEALFLSLLT